MLEGGRNVYLMAAVDWLDERKLHRGIIHLLNCSVPAVSSLHMSLKSVPLVHHGLAQRLGSRISDCGGRHTFPEYIVGPAAGKWLDMSRGEVVSLTSTSICFR